MDIHVFLLIHYQRHIRLYAATSVKGQDGADRRRWRERVRKRQRRWIGHGGESHGESTREGN